MPAPRPSCPTLAPEAAEPVPATSAAPARRAPAAPGLAPPAPAPPLPTVTTPADLRRTVDAWRAAGQRVAFVPTMGALHAGHLALVARARELAPRVVTSIFVNPTQFGPGEDFARYPRSVEEDSRLLAGTGCDLLFLPAVETIYPPGCSTFVAVEGPSRGLEGDERPGHFRGVATVVCQLLNLVRPDVAVFGQKDAQQLAVVRRMVADLHLPVAIVAHPTVREADGLALSSRNRYLDPEQRRAALVLPRALVHGAALVANGERSAAAVRRAMREVLAGEPRAAVDYAEAVEAEGFQPVEHLAGRVVLVAAIRLGATRLLDNVPLDLLDPDDGAPLAADHQPESRG